MVLLDLFWGLVRCRIGSALAAALSCQGHKPSAKTDHREDRSRIVFRRALPASARFSKFNSRLYTAEALRGDALDDG